MSLSLLATVLCTSRASAQSWSSARTRPALWQIVAIDRSGEPGWPYGAEDVAGDGVATLQPDEAEADLRTVYADANAERSWLRAYLVSERQPAAELRAFFFLDLDARNTTGGPAEGAPIEPALDGDPSAGGYERALGVSGDGKLLGAWQWSADERAWTPLETRQGALRGETGRARDPLGLGASERAYLQVDLEHALSGLNASCDGRIFVRVRREAASRSLGDDALEAAPCRGPSDGYGDPALLRSFACRADTECASGGRCREGVCLFAYDCERDEDCPSGERCTGDRCVRAVAGTCSAPADCDGLICRGAQCAACAESGADGCPAGSWCSPNGSCVYPDLAAPLAGVERVQGGAFHCSAGAAAGSASPGWWLLLSSLALCRYARRRSRARPAARAEGET